MKTDFTIRQAQQSDAVALKELFQNTVLVINRRDYSQAEVEDWASCGNNLSNIKERIETHYFVVAVNQQSQIVGFSSITPQGYLHSMFVHKDFQGEGIATMLLEEIERYAITAGITRITSEVSLTARPFFEKKGYVKREINPKDKRNRLISLTKKGIEFAKPIIEGLENLDINMLKCLSDEDIKNYVNYQKELIRFMENYIKN